MVIPTAAWLIIVPWHLSSHDGPLARIGIVLAVGAVGSAASAFAGRPAGQRFVVAATVTTLLLYVRAAATSGDALLPMLVPVFLVVALGAFVLGFALGRFLRSGSATG